MNDQLRSQCLGMNVAIFHCQAPSCETGAKSTKETAMNKDTFEGNWKQLKGKAQQKWGDLTDDELDQIEGRREVLAGKIQEKYGKSREEANREIDEWQRNNV
jgi:uncharacterized protein YjbJ (UPF0337 family)